tara:strand:+ start:11668 stop:11958 length:291 start_codon:yes stop_codon:yes gene_type:complete
MQGYKSDYEKYILISEHSRFAVGSYPSFIRMTEVMITLNRMSQKQANTYTYNGEVYVSRLTNSEVDKIQNCLDTGVYTSQFDKLKYICVDLGVRSF